MSTPETDGSWELQGEYYQDFCTFTDSNTPKAARHRLNEMRRNHEIDTETITKCEEYLLLSVDTTDEYRDDKPNRDREEDDRREKYFLGDI
jgi:hypothetical protein